MENKPIISIIVPIYDVEDYIDRCIESILNQTFKDFELILVDDGSPDNCPAICDKWAEKDSRVKVIHKPNGGLSDARNTGIDLVKTEWIMFIDSDDEIKSNALETLYNCALSNDCDIVCSSFCKIIDDKYVENNCSNSVEIFENKKAMEWYAYSKCGYTAWNKLYKTILFDNVRYPKGMVFEDAATTYKVVDKAKRLCYIDQDLFCYRIREGSILHSTFSKKNLDEIKAFEEYYSFIKSNYPELENRARRALLLSIYRNINGYISMCDSSDDEKYIEWFNILYINKVFMLKNAGFSFREKIVFLKVFVGKNLFYKLCK